jgi:hypothetical protein
MSTFRVAAWGVAALTLLSLLLPAAEEGFVPLFNGRDLDGWTNVNCAPETFTVRDGIIVSTGIPTGVMRTKRMYENFIAEVEWKHLKEGGNAGFFIYSAPVTAVGQPFTKGMEIQIINSDHARGWATRHGDVFAIHGATFTPDKPHPNGWMRSLPSEKRVKPTGEWNHYRVESRDGVLTLAVNGKVVSGGSNCVPRKGYICLESEGSECHFRNIRIKELPSTNPKPSEVADEDQGFVSLYNGLDLRGWKQDPGHAGHWKAKDWILDYDGKSESTAPDKSLWSEKSYRDFQLIVDWRFTTKPQTKSQAVILPNGDRAKNDDGSPRMLEVADAGDSGIYLRGNSKSQVNIWCWPIGSGEVYGYREDANMSPEVRAGVTPRVKADKPLGQWNRFLITMRGDRLTVVLNEKTVLENAHLPGVPAEGPIALQDHGDAIQFANIYVRELQ